MSLKILERNKFEIFETPLQGKDVLIRTGVLREHNLYHAILASYKLGYMDLSKQDQVKMALEFFNKIKELGLKTIQESKVDTDTLISNLNLLYSRKDKQISELINYSAKSDLYDCLMDSIPVNSVIEVIKKDGRVDTYVKNTFSILKLEQSRIDYLTKKYISMYEKILEYSKKQTNNTVIPFPQLISIIETEINKNIYIFGKTYTPMRLKTMGSKPKKRGSIILYNVKDMIFEPIFKLTEDKNVRIKTFEYNDMFIYKINLFLFYPKVLNDKYPSLVKYLPEQSKKLIDQSSSSDEE